MDSCLYQKLDYLEVAFEACPMQRIRPHLFGRPHRHLPKFRLDFQILLGSPFGDHQPHNPGISLAAGPYKSSPSFLIIL